MGDRGMADDDSGMLTVDFIVAAFERHLQVRNKIDQCSEKTIAWYKVVLSKLSSTVGTFPAHALTLEDLVSCGDFTNHFVRVLKALFKWASKPSRNMLRRDPFEELEIPPCGQRTRTFTEEETERLILVATPAFKLVIRLAVATGARPGELRIMTWQDVHLAERLVILTTFKAKKRRGDRKAVRPIALNVEALEILTSLRPPNPDPNALVLLNNKGKPWTSNAFRCAMRTARKKAGLDAGGESVVLYTARHTFGTVATKNGVDGRILADMMGHTTVAMTSRYQHLTSADLVRKIDQATARRQ